jgi:hypothetical protein
MSIEKTLNALDERCTETGVTLTREEWEKVKGAVMASKGALDDLLNCDMNEAAIALEELWGEDNA